MRGDGLDLDLALTLEGATRLVLVLVNLRVPLRAARCVRRWHRLAALATPFVPLCACECPLIEIETGAFLFRQTVIDPALCLVHLVPLAHCALYLSVLDLSA